MGTGHHISQNSDYGNYFFGLDLRLILFVGLSVDISEKWWLSSKVRRCVILNGSNGERVSVKAEMICHCEAHSHSHCQCEGERI